MLRREVTRERKLPAFIIDLGQLEALVDRLMALFPSNRAVRSLVVSLKNEELSFDSVDELRKCLDVPSRVTSFRVHLYELPRVVYVRSRGFLGSPATISVIAETESWCAGAVETVYSFLRPHRRWYWWFHGWPIGVLTLVSLNIPVLLRFLGLEPPTSSPVFGSAWLATVVALTTIYFMRHRLFPSAVVQVRGDESTVRRYMPELTLLVAVLALILTIIGWFVRK